MTSNNNIYLPKSISNTAITSYIVALVLVTVIFHQYAIQWYFMLFGIVEVVGFYHYGNVLSKQYSNYSEKHFRSQIFKIALLIRVVYVLFSYWFYNFMTGQPFEFGAADVLFYNDSAVEITSMFANGDFDFIKTMPNVDVSDMGYAVYLSFVYWFFFDSIICARLIKALMSAYMCVLIYNLAKRNFGESVGRLAAVFTMLCPNLIYYCGMHLKETEMVFITVLAIEKFDGVFRGERITLKSMTIPFLMLILTFTFRTVLGLSIIFAIGVNVFLSDKKVVKTSGKVLITSALLLISILFLWNTIAPQVEALWRKKDNQQANMEWRSRRENGNKFAKYAGATIFAPLIFSIPFPTMVEIPNQEDQQMVNGNNFVKNIISFWVISAIFLCIFKFKIWRKNVFIIAYLMAYLGALALSEFPHSERFHMPALPIELIFAAYGISQMTPKSNNMSNMWCVFMIAVAVAWNWFKLAGRNFI